MTTHTITIALPNRNPMVFEGEQIAFVTSQRPGEPRWTEMRIYRADDGSFVFRRTGRSVMYHRPECPRVFGRMDLRRVDDPDEDGIGCEECLPDTDDEPVLLEGDKEFARRTGDLRQLVYFTQQRQRDTNELTLTPMARELLSVAAEAEPAIRDVVRERMLAAASEK